MRVLPVIVNSNHPIMLNFTTNKVSILFLSVSRSLPEVSVARESPSIRTCFSPSSLTPLSPSCGSLWQVTKQKLPAMKWATVFYLFIDLKYQVLNILWTWGLKACFKSCPLSVRAVNSWRWWCCTHKPPPFSGCCVKESTCTPWL